MIAKPERSARPLSGVIFRNTVYNVTTQVLLIVITVVALKIVVAGMSEERFGLLSLIWLFIGYFTLLDFGVSRAITKFLAEAVARDDEERSASVFWTSMLLSAGFGTLLGALLYAFSPLVVHNLLHVSPELEEDALTAFHYAAICLPFVLLYGALRGVLMALQQFLAANIFQGAIGILQWAGACILVWQGTSLHGIILLTLIVRVSVTIVAFTTLPRYLKGIMQHAGAWSKAVSKELLGFGGWVTVTQVISPIIVYIDRFFIGALLSLTAVAYYAVPQEAVTRMLTIPLGLSLTLFPVLSGKHVEASAEVLDAMYVRSLRFLFFAMIPCALFLLLFSHDILRIWVGREFADNSSVVFQILSLGLLFNSLAQIPVTALHAGGRPDLTAKINLAELPIACVLNYVLIRRFGIVGAGSAWAFRVLLDALLLLWAVRRFVYPVRRSLMSFAPVRSIIPVAALTVAMVAVSLTVPSFTAKLATAVLLSCGYLLMLWRFVLSTQDRDFFFSLRRAL